MFNKAWRKFITVTITKKYTDILCNLENKCQNAFLVK